jgi:hypothetical protein
MASEGPHITDREHRRFIGSERWQRQVTKKLTMDDLEVHKVSLHVGWHVFDLESPDTVHIV